MSGPAEGTLSVPAEAHATRSMMTADRRYLAAAPLEDRFWINFCDVIGLPKELRSETVDQATVIDAIARIIETKSALHWMQDFAGRDVCCSIVASLKEAVNDPHFATGKCWPGW